MRQWVAVLRVTSDGGRRDESENQNRAAGPFPNDGLVATIDHWARSQLANWYSSHDNGGETGHSSLPLVVAARRITTGDKQ